MHFNKLKFTKLQNRIFRLLCIYPEITFHQKQLAKNLKVSPTAIGKSLPWLENQKIILRSNGVTTRELQLNRGNSQVVGLKRTENLVQLYETNLIEHLEENFPGCAIILFGSYSLGEDISTSDIDIVIIGTKKSTIDVDHCEKYLKRLINVQTYKTFKDIHKELQTSIINGIPLSGMIAL